MLVSVRMTSIERSRCSQQTHARGVDVPEEGSRHRLVVSAPGGLTSSSPRGSRSAGVIRQINVVSYVSLWDRGDPAP